MCDFDIAYLKHQSCDVIWCVFGLVVCFKMLTNVTCNSFMATQEFEGNPWSIGTKNCRQPLQWPMRSIIQIKLNMRINTDAMLRNYKINKQKIKEKGLKRIEFFIKIYTLFSIIRFMLYKKKEEINDNKCILMTNSFINFSFFFISDIKNIQYLYFISKLNIFAGFYRRRLLKNLKQ